MKSGGHLCALMIWLAIVGGTAYAVSPDIKISQYAHRSWNLQDGFFRDLPSSMTQTTDGYMWMGTASGLLRFDGVRSVPFTSLGGRPLPPGRIRSVLGTRDGSLWISSATILAHWTNGELTTFPAVSGDIVRLLEGSDGTIWAARTSSKGPLCAVSHGQVKCFGAADGFPSDVCCADSMAVDSEAGVWIGAGDTLLHLKELTVTIHKLPRRLVGSGTSVLGLASSSDNTMWLGLDSVQTGQPLQRWTNGKWEAFALPLLDGVKVGITDLIMDHHGALWIGTGTQGIYRVYKGKAEHYGNGDGLTSDFISWLFEDLEGNIWVKTPKGLDCFRDLRVISWSAHEGLTADNVSSVIVTQDGTVWAGNAHGLDAVHAGRVTSIQTGKGLPGERVTALFQDRDRKLWVGVGDGLTVYQNGRLKKIRQKDGRTIGPIAGITQDGTGDVWAQTSGDDRRLLRIREGVVKTELRTPETALARTLTADTSGTIWMGLKSGDLAALRNGKTELVPYDHDSTSSVRAVTAASDGSVLGATNYGVIAWRHSVKRTLSTKNGLPCNNIFAMVFDISNNLWLSTVCGIVEVEKTELELFWSDPNTQVRSKTLDVLDGAQTGAAHFDPAASRAPDGRLWFATGSVLQMVDPSTLRSNPIVPPVHVEEIVADRKRYPAHDALRLPALTRDLEIDYTALSFIAPLKVRFRYVLEGRETGWHDAGTRRQALYNDLKPGTYTFHVIACNNDGLWNNDGSTFQFVIAPAFYQTSWFRVLTGLCAVGLLWLFYVYRLKLATARLQERLDGRLEERERIARELHDTLLQGFQGLMLRFQAVMKMIPPESPAQKMMGEVLDRADGVLIEGRERVRELRTGSVPGQDLPNLLTTCGKELSLDRNPAFSLALVGTPRTLPHAVCTDAYRIGREALVNAFQHANATKVEVEITYRREGLWLIVRDDGIGLDQKTVDKGRDGHWGLAGMRERARHIGANLKIWSQHGAGTEIELKIPAKIAFAPHRISPDALEKQRISR